MTFFEPRRQGLPADAEGAADPAHGAALLVGGQHLAAEPLGVGGAARPLAEGLAAGVAAVALVALFVHAVADDVLAAAEAARDDLSYDLSDHADIMTQQPESDHYHFSEAATSAEIAWLEEELSVRLTPDLRALLEETDGVDVGVIFPDTGDEEPMRLSLVWSVADILKENRAPRALDVRKPAQLPALSGLVFFASEPSGEPVAFQTTGSVVRISHEDYGEHTIRASSLREYLTLFIGSVVRAETGSV